MINNNNFDDDYMRNSSEYFRQQYESMGQSILKGLFNGFGMNQESQSDQNIYNDPNPPIPPGTIDLTFELISSERE